MLKLAQIISNVLNPLVIFVLMVTAIIYYTTGSPSRSFKWFTASAMFAFFLTGLILFAVRRKVFTNFDVSRKKDRPLLFLASSIFVSALILLGVICSVNTNILIFLTVGLLGISTYFFVNKKIKASVHLGTYILFVSMLTFLFDPRFAFLYIFAPILGWARVKEREHTVSEVLAGSVIGIFLSVSLLFLLQ